MASTQAEGRTGIEGADDLRSLGTKHGGPQLRVPTRGQATLAANEEGADGMAERRGVLEELQNVCARLLRKLCIDEGEWMGGEDKKGSNSCCVCHFIV